MMVKCMAKLMSLHFKYLHTRINIILETICFMALVISFLIGSKILLRYEFKWINQKELTLSYKNLAINLSKIFIPLLSCYLFGNSFQKINDDYKQIIIKTRFDRIKYLVSKQLVISIVILSLTMLCNCFYLLFGKLSIPNFTSKGIINKTWIELYLIAIFYGLLSNIGVVVTKSGFAYIMIVMLYFIIQIIAEASSLHIILFPYLMIDHLSSNWILVICEIILIYWLSLIIFYYIDI